MRLKRQATDAPGGGPAAGKAAVLRRHADGATLATATTDADGFYDFRRNGNPGEVFVQVIDGAAVVTHSSKAAGLVGALSLLEIPTILQAIGDGTIPGVLDGFRVTAGTGLNISVAAGAAVLRGYPVVHHAAETLTMPASSTRYVTLSCDAAGVSTLALSATAAVDPAITLATVVSGGSSITSVAQGYTPILSGIVNRNPTVMARVDFWTWRAAGMTVGLTGSTSSTSYQPFQPIVSGTPPDPVLLSGVTYDVEATAFAVLTGDGYLGVSLNSTTTPDAEARFDQSGYGYVEAVHAATVVGTGSAVTPRPFFRANSGTVAVAYSGAAYGLLYVAVPRS